MGKNKKNRIKNVPLKLLKKKKTKSRKKEKGPLNG